MEHALQSVALAVLAQALKDLTMTVPVAPTPRASTEGKAYIRYLNQRKSYLVALHAHRSAEHFLLTPNQDLAFWSALAEVSPEAVRQCAAMYARPAA